MKKKLYDSTNYECYICGHRWIIKSDKLIKDKILDDWLKESIHEHLQIHKENNK